MPETITLQQMAASLGYLNWRNVSGLIAAARAAGETVPGVIHHGQRIYYSQATLDWLLAKRNRPCTADGGGEQEPADPADKISTDARQHEISYLKRENAALKKTVESRHYILELLRDNLAVLQAPPAYSPPQIAEPHSEEAVGLLFSDCQIGERVDPDETGGIGGDAGYNIEIFSERLALWQRKVTRIVTGHRRMYPINNAYLLCLGDILEGRDIFKGQGARLTDHIVGQFVKGLDLIAGAFRDMSGFFERLEICWIMGNHGRVGRKGEEMHMVNWEYLFALMLKEKLASCQNIVWHIPQAWWTIHEIMGWRFYLAHGDSIRSYLGIPYYGIDRADGDTTLMLQQRGMQFDYMLMGHFHSPAQWDRAWGERIVNGTFSSGNPFAAKELRRCARPT